MEYLAILGFILIAFCFCGVLLFIPLFLLKTKTDKQKESMYECGFDPFDDAMKSFDIRFYLVAILFIIFDLEVAFCLPWISSLRHMSSIGFWAMIFFLFILIVGFVYEWKEGALEWE